MEKICYIIGAGSVDDIILKPGKEDFVIAADAGFAHLEKLSVNADLVVGDFDSLGKIPNHKNIVRHSAEKDDTDMLLAVKEGLKRGYKTFVIYGGLGGRLDHTLANIQTLSYLSQQNATGYLVGDSMVITSITNGELTLSSEKKGVISIFCSGDAALGVYLKGLKYELSDATVISSIPIGVSNEFIGKESKITVKKGTLIVMWYEKSFTTVDN